MAHDSDTGARRCGFRRSADGTFPIGRLVQTGNHLRVAAADAGISDFYFNLVPVRLRFGDFLHFDYADFL